MIVMIEIVGMIVMIDIIEIIRIIEIINIIEIIEIMEIMEITAIMGITDDMDDNFDFVCVSLAFNILFKSGSLFKCFLLRKGWGPFGDDDDDDDDHNMSFEFLNGRHTFHMLQHETLALLFFMCSKKQLMTTNK